MSRQATIKRAGEFPGEVEVAVIGAGMLGLTTAWHLARAGLQVIVLDRGSPWREGSGVNAGTLALQNKPAHLLRFYRLGLRAWDELVEELGEDLGRVARGGLRVAESDVEVEHLRRSLVEQAKLGLATEWLDGSALRERAPWLAPSIVAATYCSQDGFASPLLAGRELLRGLARMDVEVRSHTAVLGQSQERTGFLLHTTAGTVTARQVVIAAGPWTDQVATWFGVTLPIHSSVNMLAVTERMPLFSGGLVITHIAGGLTFKQYDNGTCILGGGAKGHGDPASGRKDIDHARLIAHLQFHCATIPLLRQARVVRTWAGLMATPSDELPVLGPVSGCDGLFVGLGTGAGFTLGPLMGQLLARAVLSRQQPDAAVEFAPARLTVRDTALANEVSEARAHS
jgi:sarcosine oxidase, subunit beta